MTLRLIACTIQLRAADETNRASRLYCQPFSVCWKKWTNLWASVGFIIRQLFTSMWWNGEFLTPSVYKRLWFSRDSIGYFTSHDEKSLDIHHARILDYVDICPPILSNSRFSLFVFITLHDRKNLLIFLIPAVVIWKFMGRLLNK